MNKVSSANRQQTCLQVETLEPRQMLSAVQIFAGGTTGEEAFDLVINDNVAASYQLQMRSATVFEYETADPVDIDQLQIRFTNDSFDAASGSDRNLIIDKVVVDGVTYQTEHPSTFSDGSYSDAGLTPGTLQTEYLHTTGSFSYSSAAAQSTIDVIAAGSTGVEAFQIEVNGDVVGNFSVSQSFETFRVVVDGVVDTEQDVVRVEFTNDLFVAGEVDRDLFVDRVIINGTSYESEAETTYSTGTWVGVGLPHEGFLNSETLHVTGYFEYLAATDIVVNAAGAEGVERIDLQIDRQTVASYNLSTEFQQFTYRHNTKVAPDQIRVAMVGDTYDPDNDFDTNAFVDWIEIRGRRIESESTRVFSNATYNAQGLADGFGRGSTLHTEGYFQYGFALKPDTFSIPEDAVAVPLAVLANDNVATAIDVEVISGPVNGTLEQISGQLVYTPNPEFVGSDQIVYRDANWEISGTDPAGVAVDINVRQSHQNPQSLINPAIASELTPSGRTLVVEKVVQIPLGENGRQPRLNGLTHVDGRLFVLADGTVDGEGKIYEIVTDASGNQTAVLFLDVGASLLQSRGEVLSNFSPLYGLRGFAFHPEFATNGKLYVSYTSPRPENPSLNYYLSSPENPVAVESAVGEWTFDFATGAVDPLSHRQLFRVGMQTLDHPIGGMAFNPFAQPGDEDYGLLYIGHGDGSEQSAIAGDGQDGNALGKILRVNPLQSGDRPFTSPDTNPFIGSPDFPDEVFAIGFRNPHNLSFARDANGVGQLIVAETGRDNIEEINVVVSGGNYGWADREGPFVHIRDQFRLNGNIANLPSDDADNGFIYPVTLMGHDGEPGASFVGQAIAGGHVIQNGSDELDDQYIFAEFATDGRVYHIDFSDALAQTTSLDPNDPNRDSPEDLTWLTPQELTILFDHDNDDSTTPLIRDSLKDVFDDEPDFQVILSAGKERADVRFGEGPNGELYIINKRNGWVYLATNTVGEGGEQVG